jgi:FixJ family two-component response regulator
MAPPVAVIDIWMPLMNGLEVQSRLHEFSPSTRVIICTGKDNPLIRSTALTAGATAFFTKPFDDEEFLTTVRLALSGIKTKRRQARADALHGRRASQ